MKRSARQRYAADSAWYTSASAADPRNDTQLAIGLGVTAERLDAIKHVVELVAVEDGLLHISFRGRLNGSVREKAVQKVIRQVVECEKAPEPWVHKAMQNLLARAQSNMRRKTKTPGRSGINYAQRTGGEHAAAANMRGLPVYGHVQGCGCSLELLTILLRRRQPDGTNSVLCMDVASSLASLSNAPQGLRSVEYQQLVRMYTEAGVDCDLEWIWAANIEAMPIRNDGALRAALSQAFHGGAGEVVFTAIRKDAPSPAPIIVPGGP
ncbi:hypothetical protein K432DRAFT_382447 [Lepidopterella palustris CBS 459.81]|uniref:Uncharacterized protein n=1 Tax=Lepidopterella palustris CBS 459.81 TaxID=1314670 RepID=A0A8E2JF35_9PEZI|nr:hypothetical protein K432DRAFT_382447 [Lepidopterella palustris CBS 459.81]